MRPFRFGTVGSPLSTPKKPGGSVGAVHQIANLSLSALELGWVQAVRVTPETCAQIASAAQALDIALSVHAPYFINLNASEEEWPKSRQRLMDAAYYGYLAGATDIVFHPGSYFGESSAQVMKKVITRLQGCVEELEARRVRVTLRPETMGKSAMIGSLEDVLVMSQEVPQVQPCLDFAHLHARAGDGSMNSYEEWIRVLNDYAKAIGEEALQRLHIHLSGIEYSTKGERNHLPIQESDFNVRALFTALRDRGCAGRILCESPNLETDALWMQQTWDDLVNEK